MHDFKFSTEEFSLELYFEMLPLLMHHHEEITHFQDMKFSPDLETYFAMKKAGALRAYTVRLKTGKLAGYALYFVRPHVHFKDEILAQQDVIFIDWPYRKSGAGRSLVQYSDAQLKAEGIDVVSQHTKAKHNFGPMLEQEGYELMDLVYVKRLN